MKSVDSNIASWEIELKEHELGEGVLSTTDSKFVLGWRAWNSENKLSIEVIFNW